MTQKKLFFKKSRKKELPVWLARMAGKLADHCSGILNFLLPDPGMWKGAGWGMIILSMVLVMISNAFIIKPLGILVVSGYILFLLIVSIAGAIGIYIGLYLIRSIPLFYRIILFASVILLLQYWSGNTITIVVMIVSSLLEGSILGGVIWVIWKKNWHLMPTGKKMLNLIIALLGLAGLIFGFVWIFTEGPRTDDPGIAALKTENRPEQLQISNPALPGEYSVLSLTYGSGKDKHRSEFGNQVTIVTDSVDGSRFVGNWEKFHGWARTRYWGFDEKSLPLNARVWYPGGRGPFPIVLIVHGNHLDRDFSDTGYEYLARLMASRGFIFVSVDQNFLNSTWSNMFDHLNEENDCRGWLLLKHLQLWREWNVDPKNPFYDKVDLEKTSLIGHSRGGEAVAIAACFNQLPVYPDDATVKFDFHFHIRSVIAIAPVDGQYQPSSTGTFFENVSYFTIQGANDMDMQSFHGARQFQRIKFTDENYHAKAGLYVYGANHGQFNTNWGRNDVGFPGIARFNKRQLMPKEDQETIAKVFISAFLEATLLDKKEYFSLFRDYRTGIDWLPETIYLNQFEDSNCEFICTFEEDIDLHTATSDAWWIESENLTVWKEKTTPLKWGQQATRSVYTGWNSGITDSLPGSYTIENKHSDSIKTDTAAYLYFVMADAREDSNPHAGEEDTDSKDGITAKESSEGLDEEEEDEKLKEDEEDEQKEPYDLTIRLTDAKGDTASLPISHFKHLQRQIETRLLKAEFMSDDPDSELVFQVYLFPLSDFKSINPGLDIERIHKIQFIFDRTEEGVIVIDNIGFWKEQDRVLAAK